MLSYESDHVEGRCIQSLTVYGHKVHSGSQLAIIELFHFFEDLDTLAVS